MANDVVMPRLSDSMEEGTVLKWLVKAGDQVRRGEPLVEIETDKANMTYEADADGVLIETLAQEGQTLAVGEPIARIGGADEAASEVPSDSAAEEGGGSEDEPAEEDAGETEPAAEHAASLQEDRAQPDAAQEPPRPAPESDGAERIKASPLARRMAGELGVELAQIDGTGPGGRVVKADVEAAAQPSGDGDAAAEDRPDEREPTAEPQAAREGAKGETTVHEPTRLQRTVSRRMAESKATVPDFSLELTVDMTMCVKLRERFREDGEQVPSYNDMVVKAVARALREHPRVNGAYRDGKFESYSRVNVGIAVSAQDALVVPVIHDADRKSLGEISREARKLIERVRDAEITPPELSGGTFSVSNLGMYGIERFTAIVNPPQAAILTVGALAKRPGIDERGRVVALDQMTLTLICDHRILYGADGAEFLAYVRELLERPLALAL